MEVGCFEGILSGKFCSNRPERESLSRYPKRGESLSISRKTYPGGSYRWMIARTQQSCDISERESTA